MRIFLVQSAHGLHASSGGFKANLALCRSLTSSHFVTMLAFIYPSDIQSIPHERDYLFFGRKCVKIYRFVYLGVRVVGLDMLDYFNVFNDGVVEELGNWLKDTGPHPEYDTLQSFFLSETRRFETTHFFMNESFSLKVSMSLPRGIARVFIVHAAEHLPFGPYAGAKGFGCSRSQHELRRLESIESIWVVSNALKSYIETHQPTPLYPLVIPNHPLTYGDNPDAIPYYENAYTAPYITIINPGCIKGFIIFESLARRFINEKFLAVKSWAMNEYCCRALEGLENVCLINNTPTIETIWSQTKLLLVPSLWYEAFGLVVIEAMLRGIVVISSNAGGLVESHLGVPFVLDVDILSGEREQDPELRKFCEYKMRPQNIGPWVETLELLRDENVYRDVARRSRGKALEYVKALDRGVYERVLVGLNCDKACIFDNK